MRAGGRQEKGTFPEMAGEVMRSGWDVYYGLKLETTRFAAG